MSEAPRIPRSIIALAAIFAAVVFADSCWRWWTFQYETFDLAFYVQSLWLSLRGVWKVSLLDVPMLGNHAEPIVFLAVPLFALCPHPMLLVALQTLALATLPPTGWRIAQRLGLDARTSVMLAAATVLIPASGFVALHEFHPEAFAAPLILLMIEARLARRSGRFWLWFVAALACKENVALMLAGYCVVHAWLDRKETPGWQWRWNFAPFLLAAGWLGFYAKVLSPALNGGKVDYVELYSHLGRSGPEIVGHFFTAPQVALSAIWRALTSGDLVWAMLLPLLGLPLLRPRWLLIAAPLLLQHLLSWRASEWSIRLHYAAPLIPLFWIASAEALTRTRMSRGWALAIVGACVIAQGWLGPARSVIDDIGTAAEKQRDRGWKAARLAEIPPGASVTAPLPYLSHVAARRDLYSLHHILKGLKTLSRASYVPPPPTDVVVVDFGDAETFSAASGYYHPQMRTTDGRIVPSSDTLLRGFLSRSTWREFARDSFHVFTCGEPLAPSIAASEPVKISPGLALLNHRFAIGMSSIEAALEWEVAAEPQSSPWAMLVAKGATDRWTVLKGLCAPTVLIGPAVEKWTIDIPPTAAPGDYDLTLVFFDHASDAQKELPLGALPLGRFHLR